MPVQPILILAFPSNDRGGIARSTQVVLLFAISAMQCPRARMLEYRDLCHSQKITRAALALYAHVGGWSTQTIGQASESSIDNCTRDLRILATD